jgi:thiosulfate/3-mercaptopyruvate sulfurtransferase
MVVSAYLAATKTQTMSAPIIQASDLLQLQNDPQLILIDARGGQGAYQHYLEAHLAGARHADLDLQLSNVKPNPADGGRHPLPDALVFAQLLGEWGITPASTVVVYDDKNGAMSAARFWWMLRALGHQKVQVLNGGIQAAFAAGFPQNAGEEQITKQAPYPAAQWQSPMADIEQVAQDVQDPQKLVIDAREQYRYDGISEPIDLVAGHIPGAINVPFPGNLDENGLFLAPDQLKTQFEAVLAGRKINDVTVHCGSGVTACHTLLAMDYAGLGMGNLYVGSWSEWSRSGREMVTLG